MESTRGQMRALGWLLALAVSPLAFAQQPQTNAVILIQHDAVSRAISPEAYNHDLWIRWPISSNSNGSNRLLSIVTGLDWDRPSADLSFGQSGSLYISNNLPDLNRRRILEARKAWVGGIPSVVLANDKGFVSADSLLLGLEGRAVDPLGFRSPLPAGALVFYSASSWDDAEDLARRCTGRALIIEYPPEPGTHVSAAWLQGIKGVPVPESTKVAGLVPAEEALKLVLRPETYEWHEAGDAQSPQQWMSVIGESRPDQLILAFLLALFAGIAGLWSVAAEKGNRAAQLGIVLALLAPAALLLGGNLALLTGVRAWDALPFLAYFGLGMIFVPIHCLLRLLWPAAHPLFPLSLTYTVISLAADPLRTVMSPVFASQHLPVSPIASGVLIAALTASIAFSLEGGLWCRLVAVLPAFIALFAGILWHPWWAGYLPLLITPIVAVLAGSGAMRAYMIPGFALWPLIFQPWNGKLAWNVGGLLLDRSDAHAINTARQMEFLLSPAWLTILAVAVGAALFGGRFLRHQIRRAILMKPAARALFWAALATAAMGLREPIMLTSALIVLMAAFLVLLFDAAGAL